MTITKISLHCILNDLQKKLGDVFRAQSNIYERAFSQEELAAESSMIDV